MLFARIGAHPMLLSEVMVVDHLLVSGVGVEAGFHDLR